MNRPEHTTPPSHRDLHAGIEDFLAQAAGLTSSAPVLHELEAAFVAALDHTHQVPRAWIETHADAVLADRFGPTDPRVLTDLRWPPMVRVHAYRGAGELFVDDVDLLETGDGWALTLDPADMSVTAVLAEGADPVLAAARCIHHVLQAG